MTARACAAVAAVLLVLLWTGPWPAWLCAGAAACAVIAFVAGRMTVALAVVAALWTGWQVQQQQGAQWREDARVLAEVRVISLPAFTANGREFDGEARLVRRPGQPVLRIRAIWRRDMDASLRAGETWQFALQLRAPQDVPNPGAVDGLRILWRDHIHARAEVLPSPLNRRLLPAPSGLLRSRERISRWILSQVPDPAAAGLLAALAVGYTGEVGREQWQVYNATGITHLIAISGMHVTLFAVMAMALLRASWRRCPWLALRVRRESFALVGGAACAMGYALMAGYSVPTQRTVMMLLAGLAWRGLARSSTPGSALGVATLAVLATDPFAVLAAGFWLSFGAVAIILWREAARLRAASGVRGALRLQAVISAALTPATLANFSSVSLAGLLVNALAIPLFSFVLVPLALGTGALVLVQAPAALATLTAGVGEYVATPAVAVLTRIAHLPGALWRVVAPAWWYGFALMACLLLILPVAGRLRLLAAAVLLPLCCPPPRPAEGAWRALALDAGGAPLVVVLTRRHALLFGTGDRFGTRGARVSMLLEPAARSLGISRFDVLVAGGLDRDVAGGIGAVQALVPARSVLAGVDRDGEQPPHIGSCAQSRPWQWDGVRFALEPAPPSRGCRLTITTGAATWYIDPGTQPRSGRRGAQWIEGSPAGGVRSRNVIPGPGVWHIGGDPT